MSSRSMAQETDSHASDTGHWLGMTEAFYFSFRSLFSSDMKVLMSLNWR